MIRFLTLAALAFAALPSSMASAQEMAEQCKSGPYVRYQAAPGPKAFAAGKTRGCGWQIKNDIYATSAAIRAKAIEQCQQSSGDTCRIVAEQK